MATWAISIGDGVGLAAGISIILVGAFVLIAKPNSWLHRLFFSLAIMDGASTILFVLSIVAEGQDARVYFFATYYYHYVAFLVLLAVFGILFPRPMRDRRAFIATIVALVTMGVAIAATYVLDHGAYWSETPAGLIPVAMEPMGNLVNIGFVLAVSALVLRLTLALGHETSESHRRQGAYVLGGMTLAYMPFPWTVVAQDLALLGAAPFFEGRWDRVLSHWTFAGACAALIASAAYLLARPLPREARDERNFVLACYAAVGVLAIVALAMPASAPGIVLRSLALLAYPILLGYAIARYEVFDIDRKLRRAATVTFAAMGLTIAFVLVENAAENLLQQRLFAGVPSSWVSGSAAALIATIGFVPIARASRRAASKLVPELSDDELHLRKLEIYRHSVSGALADGILKEGESRTLAALRQSLGITDRDHQRILAEVAA